MNGKSILKSAVVLFILSLFACTTNPIDKKVSDAKNPALSGMLLGTDGNPAKGAFIKMIPADYNPSAALFKTKSSSIVACTTDGNGEYRIYSIVPDRYNLEARHDTCGIFKNAITIIDGSQQHLDNMILHQFGGIVGVIKMQGQSDTNQVRVTLYIPGTQRATKPVIGGAFMFDKMPEGNYQLIIDPTINLYNVKVIDVKLNPGQTLDLDTIVLKANGSDTVVIDQPSVWGIWGPGKVYNIVSNVTVPKGLTLTILPGTVVRFYSGISVCGGLLAKGNPDSLVRFCAANGATNRWNGIWVNENYDSLQLSYSIVEHAMMGVENCWNPSTMKIQNCVFRYCSGAFVSETFFNAAYNFLNVVFHDNDRNLENTYLPSGAIYTMGPSMSSDESKLNIVNCVFANNSTAFFHSGDGMTIDSRNSCYYENDSDFQATKLNKVFDATNIILNPLFMSLEPGKEDYHLQPGSPCIGAGLEGVDIGLYGSH